MEEQTTISTAETTTITALIKKALSSSNSNQHQEPNPGLDNYDIAIVVLYFMIILATGFWSMWKTKNRGTVAGYFLAGRYMYWVTVGASVFASNIGSEHFIGLAGSGAASGIGVAAFELNALLILQITGWIFLPVFLSSKVYTLPEFMTKRFGGKRLQTYLALLSLALYIFTKISVNLYSGAIFIQQARGWPIFVSVLILLGLTGVSTVTGGLASVMYTDTVQSFVMLTGGVLLTHKALHEIDGIGNLKSRYFNAFPSSIPENATTCAMPKETSFLLLRPLDDQDMPWLGFILGQTVSSMWYWCADQVIVQRLLAAKNLAHAQGGTLFAGFLKLMPLFIIIIPGMISRILFPDDVACVDPDKCYQVCQCRTGCSNIAYPRLVLSLMPSGLRGLMMAGMLAALMSGLSSIFNSCSTMFTIDIWPLIRPKASVKEQMIVGRSFVLIMIGASIAWIIVIQEMQSGELYIYIQAIQSILAPPIATVYTLSVLWPRMNEPAAFWTLIMGLLVGSVRFILDVVYQEPACGELDLRPILVRGVHYMYFALILTIICVITAVFVALITEPTEDFRLIRTTYWTRFDERIRDDEMKPETPKSVELKPLDWPKRSVKGQSSLSKDEKSLDQNDVDIMIKPIKASLFKRFYMWFCGVDATGEDDEDTESRAESSDFATSSHVSILIKTRTEKIILRFFLLLIVSLAIFIFIYFSLPFHKKRLST